MKRHFILPVYMVCFIIHRIYSEICFENHQALLKHGHAVNGHLIGNFSARDAIECARLCIRRKKCKSFSYKTTGGVCQLSSKSGSSTQSKDIVTYSDIATWPPQTDPSCYDRPCSEEETCIPSGTTDGTTCMFSCFKLARSCPQPAGSNSIQSRAVGSTFLHTCDPKFTGGDSATCLESGEWDKTLNTSCTPLYGHTCTEDSQCTSINGVCGDDAGQSVCKCPAGFWYKQSMNECVPDCGSDWIRHGEICYKIVSEPLPYAEAKEKCSQQDSQLVFMETSEENTLVQKMLTDINSQYHGYYTSLRYITKTDNWKWETDSGYLDLTYTGWHPDEPNQVRETCVVLYRTLDYQWADIRCEWDYPFICKK